MIREVITEDLSHGFEIRRSGGGAIDVDTGATGDLLDLELHLVGGLDNFKIKISVSKPEKPCGIIESSRYCAAGTFYNKEVKGVTNCGSKAIDEDHTEGPAEIDISHDPDLIVAVIYIPGRSGASSQSPDFDLECPNRIITGGWGNRRWNIRIVNDIGIAACES